MTKTTKTKPCPFCSNQIPDSGVWGLPTYTDAPDNHKDDCPIGDIMRHRSISADATAQQPRCRTCAALLEENERLRAERDTMAELLEDVMEVCSQQKEPWDSPEWVAAAVKLAALEGGDR